MKKIIYLLLLVLFMPVTQATVISNTSIWSINYIIGSALPQTKVKFTNLENNSINLDLSVSGDTSSWITLSSDPLAINANSSADLTVTQNIPANAITGTYINYLHYESNSMGIITTITKNESEQVVVGDCRLDVIPSDYSMTLVSNSAPLIQVFTVRVNKKCKESVDIKQPMILGTVQTIGGQRPIYLEGGSSLGEKDPNEEGMFTVKIDSTGLPTGTYQPSILIQGVYQGDYIKQRILFIITVTSGASPLIPGSFSTLPDCSVEKRELLLNETYKVTCNNVVNPNIDVNILYNEHIKGLKVEEPPNQYIWYFQPVKIGQTKMIIYYTYKGSQIGDIKEEDIKITSSPSQLIGNTMYFQFFPDLSKIIAGTTVNVLVKDNKTNTVLPDVQLYKNGVKLDSNSFIVNEGEECVITASLAGFPSLEEHIIPKTDSVTITITKSNPEVGEVIQINTNPEDAILMLDGTREIPKSVSFDSLGQHIITAKKSGYLSSNKTINVEEKLQVVSTIPQDIKMNEVVYIDLNKEAPWIIYWRKNNKSNDETYLDEQNIPYSKTSNRIEFKPMEKGIYTIYLRGQPIAMYDKSGWSFQFKWWYLLTLGLIGFFFIIIKGGGKRKRKGGIGYGSYTGGPAEEVTEVIR